MKQQLRRRLAYGSNASLVTVMVIGVIVLLYALSDIYRVRWDFSAEANNTLQPDTLARLKLLDGEGVPFEITAFTAQRGKDDAYFKNRALKDLLQEMDHHSAVLNWRQVDFDKERLTAEKLGVNDYGRVVIQRGNDRVNLKDRELFRRVGKGNNRRLDFTGEASIARGLAQLQTPKRRVVYVLTGHGELDPDNRGPDGLSNLVDALDQERFDVETLDLLRTDRDNEAPAIPDDAAVVFVARPLANLAPQEEDHLLGWLGRGGPLLMAVDVGTSVPGLLRRMGVSIPEGVALDKVLLYPYRDRPVPRYKNHAITTDLISSRLVTVLAHPAPVVLAQPAPEGVRATAILTTTRDGWIDRGGALDAGAAIYEPEIDGAGPANFAAAVELLPGKGIVRSSKGIGRVVVVGDGDVFTNAIMDEGPGNSTFAVNAIYWLAGDDLRLGVGVTRSAGVRRLALTKEETGTLRWLSLLLMPAIVLVLGLFTWTTRRGR